MPTFAFDACLEMYYNPPGTSMHISLNSDRRIVFHQEVSRISNGASLYNVEKKLETFYDKFKCGSIAKHIQKLGLKYRVDYLQEDLSYLLFYKYLANSPFEF